MPNAVRASLSIVFHPTQARTASSAISGLVPHNLNVLALADSYNSSSQDVPQRGRLVYHQTRKRMAYDAALSPAWALVRTAGDFAF